MTQKSNDAPKPRPAPKVPGRNGFTYKPQFGLIVRCRDEADQMRLFTEMMEAGYQPRVVCV